ncbi:MAG: magnesium transporter [Candidatus Sumerlaeaceae bacterium]|nr:magnesium transporter [Candidatus Sumerlaeaceae bacterium]
MLTHRERLDEPITAHVQTGVPVFAETDTVEQVLARLRRDAPADGVLYLYVTDPMQRLTGVVPSRKLLTSAPGAMMRDLMQRRVLALPAESTVADACEQFLIHRFLALPVVDADRRLLGTVGIDLFTDEAFNFAERQEAEDLFQWIGVRISQLRNASPWRAARLRFPWLLATISSGLICAAIATAYEATIAQALALAAFLTVTLGLGESVAVQAMTTTLQHLHHRMPTRQWITRRLTAEALTAGQLGAACGALVAGFAWAWEGHAGVAAAIGASITLAVTTAGLLGVAVPALLHVARRDPRIAAGPVALAMADICTLLFYFHVAQWWLAG